ncbi:MAG: CAP domain-containing protein [Patescibacteria group bacterium]|mgnify:CR=1 FL=1
MAKILSFGEKNPKVSKGNIFKAVWNGFNSLDRFIKFYIFYGLLVITVTPAIISGYLIFNPRAEGITPQVGTSMTQAPSSGSGLTGSLAQPASVPPDYIVDQEIISFRDIINNYRAQNGLGALTTDNVLTNIAKWMASDMANNNYFSHTDSLGRDPWVRMDQLGYNFDDIYRGENLVAGTETAPYAFQMWKDSPGHNATMLGSNFNSIGIYRAYNPNSAYGWYWATEFGGRTVQAVNYVAPQPASVPTASISGPTSATVGQTLTYTGTAWDTSGHLLAGDIYRSPTASENWIGLVTNTPLAGSGQSFSATWNTTGMSPGTYYVVVNAYSSGGKCTGNTFQIAAGWTDCGPNDHLTVTLSPPSKGDVNCDGRIDILDVGLILAYTAGVASLSDTCQAGKVYRPTADVDGNGIIDGKDALQIMKYLAGLPSALNGGVMSPASAGDSDGDGFIDGIENFIGTNPNKKCATTSTINDETPDPWPVDFDDNKIVNLSDLGKYNAAMSSSIGQANYNQRLDLNADGIINGADYQKESQYIGNTACQSTPTPLSPPTNLKAVCNSTNTQGIFSWTGSSGAIDYSFHYAGPDGSFGWSPASNPTTINVRAGYNYTWKVKACSSSGPECSVYVTGPTLTCGTLDPNADADKDGFKNGVESFVGTDPLEKCLRTKTPGIPSSAWPPDLTGDNLVNDSDILSFNSRFGAKVGAANYDKRWNLNMDGLINLQDVLQLNKYMNTTCQ